MTPLSVSFLFLLLCTSHLEQTKKLGRAKTPIYRPQATISFYILLTKSPSGSSYSLLCSLFI